MSWLINRRKDGGLGLPVKMVQECLGHSSITLIMDTYGHVFPRTDDAAEPANTEASLLQRLRHGDGKALTYNDRRKFLICRSRDRFLSGSSCFSIV